MQGDSERAYRVFLSGSGSNKLAVSERFQRSSVPVEPEQQRYHIEYNDAGRVWRVYVEEVLVAEYIYNAQGQRSRKVVHEGTEQTVTVYHHGLYNDLLTETDATGNSIRDYVWVSGRPIAQIDVSTAAERLVYLYTDHLMTPRLATNKAGVIVWSWEGSAFGESVADTDPNGDGIHRHVFLRFPGQYNDMESGWYYNFHRYYKLEIGRYITSDPAGLEGNINSYEYALNNPIRFYDPYGLEPNSGCVAACTAVGASIGGALGGYVTGALGGTAGTMVAPGVGTIGGTVGGAAVGRIGGMAIGSVGGMSLGQTFCPDDDEEECQKKYVECLHTGVDTKFRNKDLYGHSGCYPCREKCRSNDGVWPRKVKLTGRGKID